MSTIRRRLAGRSLGLLVAFALFLLYALRYILIPFALAGALAYVLTPVINWLQKRTHGPRAAVAVALYFGVLGLFGVLAWCNASRAYESAHQFSSGGAQSLHLFFVRLLGGEQITLLGHQVLATDLALHAQGAIKRLLSRDNFLAMAGLAAGVAVGIMLLLVLLFYFLLQGPRLVDGMVNLAPPEHRPGLRAFVAQVHPLLLRYLSGLSLIVLFTMVIVWVGVGPIFHLPHPVLLAITVGFLEPVPVAGPTLSAFLLGGTAVAHGGTAWTFAGFAIFCFAMRMGIDQVVGPLILGRAMRLPPAAVIFAFVAGGVLLGPLGVLLAVPGTALLKVALDNYYALPVEPPPEL